MTLKATPSFVLLPCHPEASEGPWIEEPDAAKIEHESREAAR
jgi:hypothetical protein